MITIDQIKKNMETLARQMADETIKNYPVRVLINGESVDADICDTTGGEIHIEIKTPLYFGKTGKEYDLVPRVRKGAA